MAHTVTIGKSYFEALLRRAEFHTSQNDFSSQVPDLSNNVTISKAEHEYLIRSSHEYNILRNALFRGGLTAATLDTLISGDNEYSNAESEPYNTWEETFSKPTSVPVTISAPKSNAASPDVSDSTAVGEMFAPNSHTRQPYRTRSFDPSEAPPEKDDQFGLDADPQPLSHPVFPRNDQRTILISNLSERTTHKDLAGIIRGGRLLDIYLRNDRSATVSFVEGAQEFLAYAKRSDLYLHTKRLELRWNDRQFHLPNHVANKIANGATRNLVVRGVAGKLTEDIIRDHLDHIHNLVVIDVRFENGDAYISTNSVHNSLFARTCMMSRTAYKGLRIEWYPDECAQPLRTASTWQMPVARPNPAVSAPPTNRYALLNIDGSEVDSDEDDPYLSTGVEVTNWADDTATAG